MVVEGFLFCFVLILKFYTSIKIKRIELTFNKVNCTNLCLVINRQSLTSELFLSHNEDSLVETKWSRGKQLVGAQSGKASYMNEGKSGVSK